MRAILCLTLLLGSNLAWAGDVWPPEGWRLPTDADYTKGWSKYRHWFPISFHVSGDVIGPRVIELFAYSECCAQAYARALVPPGRHLTVYGRSRECFGSAPKSVTLKNPGFEIITLATEGGLYYWSPKINAFRSISVAD
jgi:hypothetical protein